MILMLKVVATRSLARSRVALVVNLVSLATNLRRNRARVVHLVSQPQKVNPLVLVLMIQKVIT